MKQRLLALLLCFGMLCGMLPQSVLAVKDPQQTPQTTSIQKEPGHFYPVTEITPGKTYIFKSHISNDLDVSVEDEKDRLLRAPSYNANSDSGYRCSTLANIGEDGGIYAEDKYAFLIESANQQDPENGNPGYYIKQGEHYLNLTQGYQKTYYRHDLVSFTFENETGQKFKVDGIVYPTMPYTYLSNNKRVWYWDQTNQQFYTEFVNTFTDMPYRNFIESGPHQIDGGKCHALLNDDGHFRMMWSPQFTFINSVNDLGDHYYSDCHVYQNEQYSFLTGSNLENRKNVVLTGINSGTSEFGSNMKDSSRWFWGSSYGAAIFHNPLYTFYQSIPDIPESVWEGSASLGVWYRDEVTVVAEQDNALKESDASIFSTMLETKKRTAQKAPLQLYEKYDAYRVRFDSNGGSGTMEPVIVEKGQKYTLPECTFTAPEGYKFDGWDKGAAGTEIEVDRNMTIKPVWKELPKPLTLRYEPGLGMGEAFTEIMPDRTQLMTFPECPFRAPAGRRFSGWLVEFGPQIFRPGMQINMDHIEGNQTVMTAYYEETGETVYTATTTNGSILIDGTGYPAFNFVAGDTVTVKADPAVEGKTFDSWQLISGDIVLADTYAETTTFTMPYSDVELKANYKEVEPVKYAITVENGTSSVAEAPEGTVITVTANTATEGKAFDKWEVVAGTVTLTDPTAQETTFTMPAEAVSVKAVYKELTPPPVDEYNITVENGTTNAATAPEGTVITVTANTATEGKAFDKWEVISGTVTLADPTAQETTFTMPAEAVTVRATYKNVTPPEPVKYAITVENGTATAATAPEGTVITVTANTATDGTAFDKWEVVTGTVTLADPTALQTTFTMPAEAVTVRATYKNVTPPEPVKYAITVENGTSSVAEAPEGTGITVTANTATDGTAFDKWEVVTGTVILADPTAQQTTFTMPAEAVTVRATYKNVTPVKSNSVTPETVTFDANANEGIDFRLASTIETEIPDLLLNGLSWKNSDGAEVSLQENDYRTRWGNSVLLKKEFLLKQTPGTYTLTFNMEQGNSPVATVIIPDTWKITLSVTPEDGGTIDKDATVLWDPVYYVVKGETAEFDASESQGYLFVQWNLNGVQVSTNSKYSFTPQADCTLQAVFEEEKYELTVTPEKYDFPVQVQGEKPKEKTFTVTNTGNQTLKLEASEVDFCTVGAFGSKILQPKESTTITVTLKGDLAVGELEQILSISGYIPIPVEEDDGLRTKAEVLLTGNVVAPSVPEYTITVQNGSSSAATAPEGTDITVTANTATEGKVFDKWEVVNGTVTLTDPTAWQTTFTMPAEAVTVKATYKNVTPVKNNSVTPETVTFDANANEGIDFRLASTIETELPNLLLNGLSWKNSDGVAVTLQENDYRTRWGNSVLLKKEFLLKQTPGTYTLTFNMEQGNSPVATVIIPDTWKITLSVTPEDGGTIDKDATVLWDPVYYVVKGEAAEFDASESQGYLFVQWNLNGVQVSTNRKYSFTPQADCTLQAVFEEEKYELTVTPDQYDFPVQVQGEELKSKTFTVTNTGNQTLKLTASEVDFCTVGAFGSDLLEPKESTTFTVTLKEGLEAGELEQILSISGLVPNPVEEDDGLRTMVEVLLTGNVVAPSVTEYTITVQNGSSSAAVAAKGTEITVTADIPEGQEFDHWEIIRGDLVLADKHAPVTTFTMPEENVIVKATFRNKEVKPVIPETGDDSHWMPYILLGVISLAGILAVLLKRKNQDR